MIFIELFNAISMVSPLFAWLKHRKRKSKSKLHSYLPIQLVFSATYHTCCALLNNPKINRILRAVDIFSIHICSMMCCIDGIKAIKNPSFKRRVRLYCLYSSIPLLIYDMAFNVIINNKVICVHRLALIVQNNVHFLYLIPLKDNSFLIISGATCAYFYKNTSRGLSHTYFHLSLYALFDEYFQNYDQILQNLTIENNKLVNYKDDALQITLHN